MPESIVTSNEMSDMSPSFPESICRQSRLNAGELSKRFYEISKAVSSEYDNPIKEQKTLYFSLYNVTKNFARLTAIIADPTPMDKPGSDYHHELFEAGNVLSEIGRYIQRNEIAAAEKTALKTAAESLASLMPDTRITMFQSEVDDSFCRNAAKQKACPKKAERYYSIAVMVCLQVTAMILS
jgi:hypothetical protein